MEYEATGTRYVVRIDNLADKYYKDISWKDQVERVLIVEFFLKKEIKSTIFAKVSQP